MSEKRIYTMGHSNLGISDFIEILKVYGVELLCDIRSWPRSRKWPQFDRDSLAQSLETAGIDYAWLGNRRGGWRKNVPGSERHRAIRSEGFRAYVAHLSSEEGQAGIDELAKLAARKTVACMCAEKLPFRCHRWFLSDFLVLRGFEVIHIIDRHTARPHRLSPLIRLENGKPIYDRTAQPELDGLE